jgi:hypothetical protein
MMTWQTIMCLCIEGRKSKDREKPFMMSITERSLGDKRIHASGEEYSKQE